jgi:hypothetical protein
MHPTVELLVAIALTAFGAASVIWSLWELVQSIRSSGWLRTEGVVVVSDLQRSRDTDAGYTYRPEISYSYSVGGHDFVASRPKFGAGVWLSWSGPAVRTTRKYPAGGLVTVWYDPADPQESVLETGVSTLVWASLAGGLLILAFGVGTFAAAT